MQSNQSTEIKPTNQIPLEQSNLKPSSPIPSPEHPSTSVNDLKRRLEFEEAKSKDRLSSIANLETSFSHQIEGASKVYLSLMNEYYAASEKSIRQETELQLLKQTIGGLREALEKQGQGKIGFEQIQANFGQLYNSMMANLSNQTEKDREVITRAIREYQQSLLQPLSKTLKEIQNINELQLIPNTQIIENNQVTRIQSNDSGYVSDMLSKRTAPGDYASDLTTEINPVMSKLYRENLKLKAAILQFEQKLTDSKIDLPKACIDVLRHAELTLFSETGKRTVDFSRILAEMDPSHIGLYRRKIHNSLPFIQEGNHQLAQTDIGIEISPAHFEDLYEQILATHKKIQDSILMTHDLQAQVKKLTAENEILRNFKEHSERQRINLTDQLQSVSQQYSDLLKSIATANNQQGSKSSIYQESFNLLLKSCTSLLEKIRSSSGRHMVSRPVSTETLFETLNSENDRLSERVVKLSQRIDQLISEKQQIKSEYDKLHNEFIRKDTSGVLSKLSNQITESQSTIEHLQTQISLLETQLTHKTEEITDLRSKLADLTQTNTYDHDQFDQNPSVNEDRFARPGAEEEFETRLTESSVRLGECRQYIAYLRKKIITFEHDMEVKEFFRDGLIQILEHQAATSSTN